MTQKAPLLQSGVFFVFFYFLLFFFPIYIKKLEYQNIRDLPWGRQVLILSKKSRSLSVGLRSLGRPEPWPHANSQICFHHPLLPQLPSMFPRTRRAQWEKQRSLSQPDLSSSPEAATYSPVSPLTSLTCFIISEVGSIFLTREITRTQRGVSLALHRSFLVFPHHSQPTPSKPCPVSRKHTPPPQLWLTGVQGGVCLDHTVYVP